MFIDNFFREFCAGGHIKAKQGFTEPHGAVKNGSDRTNELYCNIFIFGSDTT